MAQQDPSSTSALRPLLVTSDPQLLDDVLRLAAASGVDVEVAPDPAAARASWSRAPLVMIGDELAIAMGRARLRRRAEVIVVGRDLDDGGIWKRAVGVGAGHVALLPDAEPWLVSRLADAAEPTEGGGRSAVTIGVIGGRGGAGASTLAAAMAITGVRQGHRSMLIDADPYGGGADLLFGGESAPGLRWPDLASAQGRIGGQALREALPGVGELAVLSWDRGDPLDVHAEAMGSVLAAATRVCAVVVIDLPRRFDDVTDIAMSSCDLVLLVVPAEVRATASAARIAGQLARVVDDVRVVVRGPAPGGLGAADISAALGLPLAGHLKAEPDLANALERGEAPGGRGRGPLANFCAAFLNSNAFLNSGAFLGPTASRAGNLGGAALAARAEDFGERAVGWAGSDDGWRPA